MHRVSLLFMCMHAYQALKFVPKIAVSAFALALLPVTLLGLPSVYGSLFGFVRLVGGNGVVGVRV